MWELREEIGTFLVTVVKTDKFAKLQDLDWVGACNGPSEQPQSEVAWEECTCARAVFIRVSIQSQGGPVFLFPNK